MRDVEAVTAACQDPEISRWTAAVPTPYEESDAHSWIAKHAEHWEQGTAAQFAMIAEPDHRFLGSLGIHNFDWTEMTAVAGYWVAAPERRHGAATRALRLGVRWAFEDLGIQEVHLVTMVGNLPSERVAEKVGFRLIGEDTEHRVATASNRQFHVKKWKLAVQRFTLDFELSDREAILGKSESDWVL